MVCPLRGGGIPLFVKFFSLSYIKFLGKSCLWLPPKQKFSVTGIIEFTPKTLQNYGFYNIGLTPPPLFPQSYHSGGFDDKRVVLGRRKKNWNCR